ncbi:hypothetical protein AEP_00507 [Curvibacter sp. AEP1-3]|uniref:lysis system i-spanin subunit Rz n=1 Tax=Curvibacter sp. AEP1-3 TaxID=1844971 RepID=UPI000B3CB783|nr:lysis system i-spanin subunit Rz [Curvibacter sp. AEP1-3]ARV17467.1 hypothetical protein AEP_00507 [Curvibacter sp. AEP1-3]
MKELLIAIALVAVGFFGGWAVNGWRLDAEHGRERIELAKQRNDQLLAAIRQRDDLADKVDQVDKTRTAQLTKARNENKALTDRLAAGTTGLHIDATCPGTGPTQTAQDAGVDSGAAAELTAAARQAYTALRQNIIETEGRLSACQELLTLH